MLAFISIFSLVLNLQGNSLLTPQKSKADAFSSIVNAIRECQERAAVLADAMSAYQQVKGQDNSGGNTLEFAENNMNNAVAAFEGCQYLTE